MGDKYVLSYERIQLDDDKAGGRWTIRRITPDTPPGDLGEFVVGRVFDDLDSQPWENGARDIGEVYLAQDWATSYLYGLEIRVTSWATQVALESKVRKYVQQAATRPWYGQWEINARIGQRQAVIYHLGRDGTWTGQNGVRYPDLDTLHRSVGPTRPYEVTSLAALIAELYVYRSIAGYVTAPGECMEAACDDFIQAEQERDQRMELCSHMTPRVASRWDTFRVDRIDRALRSLEYEVGVLVEDPDRTDCNANERARGIAAAVKEIRDAYDREDDE